MVTAAPQKVFLRLVLIAMVLVGFATPVSAQTAEDLRFDRSARHCGLHGGSRVSADYFERGRAAMQRGDYGEACGDFRASDDDGAFCGGGRAPGTLLNLAACSEKLKRAGDAARALETALRGLPASDDRRSFAEQQLARLLPRVGHIVVRTADFPTDAIVTLDAPQPDANELSLADLGVPLAVDPGTHVVVASLRGQPDQRFEINVRAGETKEISIVTVELSEDQLVLAEAEPAPPATLQQAPQTHAQVATVQSTPSPQPLEAPPSTEEQPSSGRRTLGYALVGGGALGVAVAFVAGGFVLARKDTVETHCDASLACDQQGVDAAQSGKTLSAVSTVSFILGAAAGGAGAYVLLSDPSQHQRGSVAVGTRAGPGGVDAVLFADF